MTPGITLTQLVLGLIGLIITQTGSIIVALIVNNGKNRQKIVDDIKVVSDDQKSLRGDIQGVNKSLAVMRAQLVDNPTCEERRRDLNGTILARCESDRVFIHNRLTDLYSKLPSKSSYYRLDNSTDNGTGNGKG